MNGGAAVMNGGAPDPPPTKWTISRRSPSCNGVCGHWSRGTISRLSSIATRFGFMPSPATSAPRVSADETWGSPLIVRFIESILAAGSARASLVLDGRGRPSPHLHTCVPTLARSALIGVAQIKFASRRSSSETCLHEDGRLCEGLLVYLNVHLGAAFGVG